MSIASSKETGSAATLSGLEDAKADCPASPTSPNQDLTPEQDCGTGASPQIDGDDLLERVSLFLRRFICYPSPEACTAHVLWIAHTHLMDEWFSTPRLAVTSPEKGSGKTRVLEMTALLVPRPIFGVNTTRAYIMRMLENQEQRPTLILDEIDTIYGPSARGDEQLRGLLNAGYRRGATTGICEKVGGKIVPRDYPTYAAVALGGLGSLPDTIMSRSIIIRMRRRARGESAEPFQPRRHEQIGCALGGELAAWSVEVAPKASLIQPTIPAGIVDRDEDIWSPLLVIAELAGGRWPRLAEEAALALVAQTKAESEMSPGVHLLTDVKRCFGDEDRLSSEELVRRLVSDPEAPWGDIRGRKLDQRGFAKLLSEFGIRSRTIRLSDSSTPKGYLRDMFEDAWCRYLPPEGWGGATADTNDTFSPSN